MGSITNRPVFNLVFKDQAYNNFRQRSRLTQILTATAVVVQIRCLWGNHKHKHPHRQQVPCKSMAMGDIHTCNIISWPLPHASFFPPFGLTNILGFSFLMNDGTLASCKRSGVRDCFQFNIHTNQKGLQTTDNYFLKNSL